MSRQLSIAADDAPHPTVFARLGVLHLPTSTRPRPSDPKPHWARHLVVLVTKPGEACGLPLSGGRVSTPRNQFEELESRDELLRIVGAGHEAELSGLVLVEQQDEVLVVNEVDIEELLP